MTIGFWTEDRVKKLRELNARGVSSGEVAVQLNCTRSAVIGKADRMGLEWRDVGANIVSARVANARMRNNVPVPLISPTTIRKMARSRTHTINLVHAGVAEPPGPVLISGSRLDAKEHATSYKKSSLMELGPRDCKFPFGDVGGPNFFFCGKPQADRPPYCAECARLSYVTPQRAIQTRGHWRGRPRGRAA